MEVTAYWSGGYRCRVPIRQFQLLADEPEDVAGGTDTGPTPTELLLASLATCFAMALAHVTRDASEGWLELKVPGDSCAASFS